MVAADWQNRHPEYLPFNPQTTTGIANSFPFVQGVTDGPTRGEFDALKRELEALKKLLAAAKEYDAATGQRDCEDAEKVALFKRLATLTGVDLGL